MKMKNEQDEYAFAVAGEADVGPWELDTAGAHRRYDMQWSIPASDNGGNNYLSQIK